MTASALPLDGYGRIPRDLAVELRGEAAARDIEEEAKSSQISEKFLGAPAMMETEPAARPGSEPPTPERRTAK